VTRSMRKRVGDAVELQVELGLLQALLERLPPVILMLMENSKTLFQRRMAVNRRWIAITTTCSALPGPPIG
jgi:hypothetical protein